MRHLTSTAALLIAAATAFAQEPTPKPADAAVPTFEVASVKSNESGSGSMSISSPPERFTATNVPLRLLIRNAFSEIVRMPSQLEGGPAWIDTERFDIAAKAPDGAAATQTMLMLRSLLAERFKLVVHTETREVAVYALVQARADGRLGPKLTRTTEDCEAIVAARVRGQSPSQPQPSPPKFDERPVCVTRMMGRPDPGGGGITLRLSAGGTTMTNLAGLVASYAGRHVLDRTGLTGLFDVELQFAPPSAPRPLVTDAPGSAAPVAVEEGATVFTALQEQLGLKLESARGPVEFVVIDSVDRPTPD